MTIVEKGREQSVAAADDTPAHDELDAELDDAAVDLLDDDGAPVPRRSGPAPKSTRDDGFARAAGVPRYSRTILPEASLPREGGLIAGKYRVDGVHFRDAFVVTLKASHIDLGQRVWVRYLLPSAARRPDAMARFFRAARSVAKMRSDHAARILDVGRIRSGVPYVVLDDMNGWDLDEVLRVRGPLPVQEAVEYVLQAAEAVAEAHALGIVHGAIRPSNVLLIRRKDESPLVKVVGFELSNVIDWTLPHEASDAQPSAARYATTLPYLAPEQIRGVDYIDERADVWALGAVLHALLTGGPPFHGKTSAALLAAVAADEPRRIGEVRGDVAPDLEALVLACLQKSPSERPARVSELASALVSFAPGDGIALIDRISRMPSSVVAPPPLPLPLRSSQAIVPLTRVRKTAPAPARAPSTTQSLLLTALVGLVTSVLGATAVIVAANAGAGRAAREAAAVQPAPAVPPAAAALADDTPAALAAPAGRAATHRATVAQPKTAQPAGARAESAEGPAARARIEPSGVAPRRDNPAGARDDLARRDVRSPARSNPVTASTAAGAPRDLFDDTR